MELSILIPARNEEWLEATLRDILEHTETEIEILVGLDDWMPDFLANFTFASDGYVFNKNLLNKFTWCGRVDFYHSPRPIGQRALTNELAKRAKGKYVMKVDAHCSFSQGFDKEMLGKMDNKTIMSPLLMKLHVYDWMCKDHFRTYQGKQCCNKAEKIVIWKPKPKPAVSKFTFSKEFVMQFEEEQPKGGLVETMCLQGSAWMIDRETYFKWNICDEQLGSWGCQAVELGIKAYLNGGRCVTNTDCYYAHMFRELEDFPYDRGENPGKLANEKLQEMYKEKIRGLVEKFYYPANWKDLY